MSKVTEMNCSQKIIFPLSRSARFLISDYSLTINKMPHYSKRTFIYKCNYKYFHTDKCIRIIMYFILNIILNTIDGMLTLLRSSNSVFWLLFYLVPVKFWTFNRTKHFFPLMFKMLISQCGNKWNLHFGGASWGLPLSYISQFQFSGAHIWACL